MASNVALVRTPENVSSFQVFPAATRGHGRALHRRLDRDQLHGLGPQDSVRRARHYYDQGLRLYGRRSDSRKRKLLVVLNEQKGRKKVLS